MSDTPRTDSVMTGNSDPCQDEYEDLAQFARTLEREVTQLQADLEESERHNVYTLEESLRAARHIALSNGQNPTRVFASMRERIWWLEMEKANKAWKDALVEANGLLRSMHAIAERQGKATNWGPFLKQLDVALDVQHRLMYPTQYAGVPL